MSKNLILISFAAALFSCNNAADKDDNTTDTATAVVVPMFNELSTDSGWVSLFDGTSTNGWHSYGQPVAGKAWNVKEGVLYLDTTNKKDWQIGDGGDLTSNKIYKNFDLKLEWKISPAGNSGIMFHVNEDTLKYKHSYWTGPEMQILDKAHPDATVKHMAGDLYDLISSTKRAEKNAGEWNKAEIVCNNSKLDYYLNGVNTVSTFMWDDQWNKMIAASKFAEWPDFGTMHEGHIVLQDHGNMVEFRNIMIMNLP